MESSTGYEIAFVSPLWLNKRTYKDDRHKEYVRSRKLWAPTWTNRYLVITGEALVHDVVEMYQEVTVGWHVLMFGHHLTDQSVSLQFSALKLDRQHGGLGTRGKVRKINNNVKGMIHGKHVWIKPCQRIKLTFPDLDYLINIPFLCLVYGNHTSFINKWLTLKSQDANIRSGGMNRVLRRADWLSALIPRLSLIWEHGKKHKFFSTFKKIKKSRNILAMY